jgi:hypothetical protein
VADEEDGQDPGEQGLWVFMTVEPLPGEEYKQGGPVCGK